MGLVCGSTWVRRRPQNGGSRRRGAQTGTADQRPMAFEGTPRGIC